jgi:hypothetical protein
MPKEFQDIKTLKKEALELVMVGGVKQVKFSGFKVSPSKPTAAQIEKINQLTRRTFKADELYIGQMRLAHNAIDRDNERFSEEVLQRFLATAVRKTMLLDHDRSVKDSAAGKFFDVEIEKMPLQQANEETGLTLKLPDGMTEVWFHSPWFYIPVEGIDPKELVKIDAGIYDWASIGFRAEKLVPIMDKDGKPLFWEYRGTGDETEMTEGSLVYLGAQPGAAVKTAGEAGDKRDQGPDTATQHGAEPPAKRPAESHEGGTVTMKELLERLKIFFGRTFSETDTFDELKAAVTEKTAEAVQAATRPLNDRIKELLPLAADGRTYRNNLVSEYISLKVKLGEASEKPENQDALKEMVAAYPIDFLKSEIGLLKVRVYEKFPSEAQLTGSDNLERTNKTKKNPLIPGASA